MREQNAEILAAALRELVRLRDAEAENAFSDLRAGKTNEEVAAIDITLAIEWATAWCAARDALSDHASEITHPNKQSIGAILRALQPGQSVTIEGDIGVIRCRTYQILGSGNYRTVSVKNGVIVTRKDAPPTPS